MIKGKIANIFALMAGVLLFASGAQANVLDNASFETPDASSGDIAGAGAPWGVFNSNFTSSNLANSPPSFFNPVALDGNQVQKQFGADAGLFQDAAATEGELWEASAWAISWTGDPFNNIALVQLFFLDDADTNLCDPGGFGACAQVDADSLGNGTFTLTPSTGENGEADWTLMSVSAQAPADTTKARIQLLHVLSDGTPSNGSVFWDAASMQVVPVPAAVWLFGSALGLLAVARRRISA